jgi:hypothetical protein
VYLKATALYLSPVIDEAHHVYTVALPIDPIFTLDH